MGTDPLLEQKVCPKLSGHFMPQNCLKMTHQTVLFPSNSAQTKRAESIAARPPPNTPGTYHGRMAGPGCVAPRASRPRLRPRVRLSR